MAMGPTYLTPRMRTASGPVGALLAVAGGGVVIWSALTAKYLDGSSYPIGFPVGFTLLGLVLIAVGLAYGWAYVRLVEDELVIRNLFRVHRLRLRDLDSCEFGRSGLLPAVAIVHASGGKRWPALGVDRPRRPSADSDGPRIVSLINQAIAEAAESK